MADGDAAREHSRAIPTCGRITICELALRYALENTALDDELEAERLRLARERRPAYVGPGRGAG